MLLKTRNLDEKSRIRLKSYFLRKIENSAKNRNFGEKSKCLVNNWSFGKTKLGKH